MTSGSLARIDKGVWCLDSHFVTWGCKGSVRMTVLRCETGLVLYSPVALDPQAVIAIRALGEVTAIIAPNLYHHLYLRECAAAFPEAAVFIPDGLEKKIGLVDAARNIRDWKPEGDISALTVAGHGLNETVLFHHPSGTLVTADLLYNFQAEHHATEKLFFRSIGCYGRPSVAFYHRFAITDKSAMKRSVVEIGKWPMRRIIMSHGRIIESDKAGEVFVSAWKGLV